MRTLIILSIVIASLSGKTYSQSMWMDENKKLYINQVLPIYLKLSTKKHPGQSKMLTENHEEKPENIKPVYFPKEGKNIIKTKTFPTKVSPDSPSVKNYEYEVFVDGTAPISKIRYEGFGVYKKDNRIYVGPKAEVHLSAKDKITPIEGIYFSINKAPFLKYKSPFKITHEGENLIYYHAVDRVGNVELLKTDTIIGDFTAPECTVLYTPSPVSKEKQGTLIFGKEVLLEIKAEDNKSGVNLFEYSINEKEFIPYKEKIQLKLEGSKPEKYHLIVRYKDHLGNEGVTQVKFILKPGNDT